MEKNIEIANIYETYKKMLTLNMQDIFELYYFADLSLREIGENKGVSYQAVRDTVKTVEKLLLDYEVKLGMYDKKLKIKKAIIAIENEDYEKTKKILKNLGEK